MLRLKWNHVSKRGPRSKMNNLCFYLYYLTSITFYTSLSHSIIYISNYFYSEQSKQYCDHIIKYTIAVIIFTKVKPLDTCGYVIQNTKQYGWQVNFASYGEPMDLKVTGLNAITLDILRIHFRLFLYPRPTKEGEGGGVYWIHIVRPSVRLSVRPSVCL